MDGQRETYNTSRQPVRGLRIPVVPRGHIIHAQAVSYHQHEAFGEPHHQEHIPMQSIEDTVMQDAPNHWDRVENETPEYLRRQREEIAAPMPRVNVAAAFHDQPFAFGGPSQPMDITDDAGHRVRVCEHDSPRHVTFASNVAPPRPARATGRPPFEVERCPTPFPPLRPAREPGTAMYEVRRRPTPFPDLQAFGRHQMPTQRDDEVEQRHTDEVRACQKQRLYDHHAAGRPDGGIHIHTHIHTGPLPRHPDGTLKHPPFRWRATPEINERQMRMDEYEYGTVHREDRTPDTLAAADPQLGIDNTLRATKPTWEEEDDSDDVPIVPLKEKALHPLRAHPAGDRRHGRDNTLCRTKPTWEEEDDSDDVPIVPVKEKALHPLRAHPAADRQRGRDTPLRPTKPTWEQEDDSDSDSDDVPIVPVKEKALHPLRANPAADQRRGRDNILRRTKPTWEQEDDSDDVRILPKVRIVSKALPPLRPYEWPEEEGRDNVRIVTKALPPLRAHEWTEDEDEDGDDEASVRQNRPEDYERPRARCGRRGRDMIDLDNPIFAPVNAPEEPSRPAISLHPGLNQAPLYGKLVPTNDRRPFRYHRTTRFNDWLETAADNLSPPNDFFHEWLREKEAKDAQKRIPTKMPVFDPPKPSNVVPAQATADSPTSSSFVPLKEKAVVVPKVKVGKRGADSPEAEGRPSKRVRLASTCRRKLSLHSNGTNNGTTHGSADTSMGTNKRRLSGMSGLNIFNVPSLSTLRGLSSLSRAASVGPKRVRIAIVGDSVSGKTTMLNRLYTGMYQPAEKSAHYRNNDFNMNIDGHPLILEAWDIPSELPADETHPLNRSFFDAALICFSVDNMQNVDKAHHWVSVLQSCLVVDIPLYLVGLKSDARPSFPMLRLPFMNEANPSSREQCEDIARKIGAVEYFECSAKTGEGVNEMFNTVVQHARSKKDEEELKRASHLRKEKLKRGVRDTGRRLSQLFCGPGAHV